MPTGLKVLGFGEGVWRGLSQGTSLSLEWGHPRLFQTVT